jgi:hypothetical protein
MPSIGRPIIDFLCNWVQAHKKDPALDQQTIAIMTAITNILIDRIRIPAWSSIDVLL